MILACSYTIKLPQHLMHPLTLSCTYVHIYSLVKKYPQSVAFAQNMVVEEICKGARMHDKIADSIIVS